MIAAIDPGSEKTGVAVLGGDGSLAEKKIIPTGDLEAYLTGAYAQYRFTHIVMGDGTNHKRLQPVAEEWIRRQAPAVTFSLVDEKNTTVEGRAMYFKYMPLSLQYPPEPVDDFVAWIIGLRYIHRQGGIE